jgi:hypothetical protein
LAAAGGTGIKTWTDEFAGLTGTGLNLSSSGLLSGTPVAVGQISFTAHASDQVGSFAEQSYQFTINPAIVITTDSLMQGVIELPYSLQLTATGGTGALTWIDRDTILAGSGLSLSPGGLLSGTPIAPDELALVIRVTDVAGGYAETPFTLTIVRPYVCGDANGDGIANIADAVFLINYVFNSGPAPDPFEAGDANCDGAPNVADAVYLINYVFKGGPEPCCL